MLKGYNDGGARVKVVHFPLRQLLMCKNERRCLNDPMKHLNWGKVSGSCGAIRWPYSATSLNGYNPFTGDSR